MPRRSTSDTAIRSAVDAGVTRSANERSEMPRAHMPRNSPPCRIGRAVGITALGVTRLASWALDSELAGLAHQPEDFAVGEAHADGDRCTGAACGACRIGDEGGRILVGELLQHLPEIGLAAVDVGRTGVRAGAQPDGVVLAHRHQQAARGFDQLAMAGDHQVGSGGHRLGLAHLARALFAHGVPRRKREHGQQRNSDD